MINFCLGINCNISDGGILPKNICVTCLDKLQIAFELKAKGQESDKYLKEILKSAEDQDVPITPYEPQQYYPDDHDNDNLLEPLDVSSDHNGTKRPKGSKSGDFVCSDCGKSFKYEKPYKNHLKLHKNGLIVCENEDQGAFQESFDNEPDVNNSDSDDSEFSPKKGKQRDYVCQICRQTFKYKKPFRKHMRRHNQSTNKRPTKTRLEYQPPYDTLSPYQSPTRFESSPVRESSPDLNMMMVNSSFLNGHPSSKKQRTRKQDLSSKYFPRENSPEFTTISNTGEPPTIKPRRGRGRPRKVARIEEEKEKEEDSEIDEDDSDEDSVHPVLANFSEVDVTVMLKKKPISFTDDPVSKSSPRTTSRSRSASVEVVQEFDIFGSVVTDKVTPKIGFGSGNTFPCSFKGCSKKFHLKANLKKHQRETHGLK